MNLTTTNLHDGLLSGVAFFLVRFGDFWIAWYNVDMFNVIPIAVIAGYLAFLFPLKKEKAVEEKDPKFEAQMKKLWQVAQSSMREKKPVRAEKALLTILKFDEKNAAAYNRLGILYAKDRKYDEAIECFEIAESLDNNASSLHNVGLIYLETGAYEKAVMALKQAIQLEGDVATRYIALAKAEEKLGNRKNALENLEMAYELDHSTATLRQILAIHENAGDMEKIAETTARIERQIAEDARIRENRQRERRTVARHRSPVRMVSRSVRARSRATVRNTGATSSGSVERVKNHAASRLRIARAVGAASVAEVENESGVQRKKVAVQSAADEGAKVAQRRSAQAATTRRVQAATASSEKRGQVRASGSGRAASRKAEVVVAANGGNGRSGQRRGAVAKRSGAKAIKIGVGKAPAKTRRRKVQ